MTIVRRPIVVLAPVAVLLVLLALTTNVLPIRQIVDQRDEIVRTEERLAVLTSENAALEKRAAALETSDEVERIAREDLGYVMPGEIAYIVMSPEEPANDDSLISEAVTPSTGLVDQPAEGETQPEESRSGVTRLLDFLTGRDLADG